MSSQNPKRVPEEASDPSLSVTLDGETVDARPGETILELAERHGKDIPTLCHDPRLAPAGACRSCLVEVEGSRRLIPSCATPVADGQVVTTANDRIARHQKVLLALYLADQPDFAARGETPGGAQACELHAMADAVGAPTDWPKMEPLRVGREDRNPYVQFFPEACILCARCTRYCAEIESVSAISLAGRGAETTIATADDVSLLDSSCELCGGCIDVCPTGAMTEKMPVTAGRRGHVEPEKVVRTTCNYCGVGCQMDLHVEPAANDGRGRIERVVSPEAGTTTNDGNLCVKGRFAYDFVDHEDRLTTPLIRAEDGSLREASWDEALARTVEGLMGVHERHGADALAFVSSSRCTMEENYLVQKMARAVFGTNNVHQCAAT